MAGEVIHLDESLFLGAGKHKKCWRHPSDAKVCVKLAYNEEGEEKDLPRELRYRRLLESRKGDYSVLPAYYGTAETDQGTGYLFEMIEDYDGATCRNLRDYFKDEERFERDYPVLVRELLVLKKAFFENEIITMNLSGENIFFQRTAPDAPVRVRFIGDLGSPVALPLEYYCRPLARAKVKRHWENFLKYLTERCSFGVAKRLAEAIK